MKGLVTQILLIGKLTSVVGTLGRNERARSGRLLMGHDNTTENDDDDEKSSFFHFLLGRPKVDRDKRSPS